MTWIATAVIGASTAYGAYQGGKQADAYADAEKAAGKIKEEKLGILGREKYLGGLAADLGYDVAQSQYAGGVRDVGIGAQMGMRDIKEAGISADIRSGFATRIDSTKVHTENLMAKYKSDMTKLFETREFAGKQRDITQAQQYQKFHRGEVSADEAYYNTMAGFDQGGVGEGALGGLMTGIGAIGVQFSPIKG